MHKLTMVTALSMSSNIEPFPTAPQNVHFLPSSPQKPLNPDREVVVDQLPAKQAPSPQVMHRMAIIFSSKGVKLSDRSKPFLNFSGNSVAKSQKSSCNIEAVVNDLDIEERKEFWARNRIAIHINFSSEADFGIKESSGPKEKSHNDNDVLFELINGFHPEISSSANMVSINIHFPAVEDTDPLRTTVPTSSNSANYACIERLVDTLNSFTSLAKLQVILHTPAYSQNPLPMQNLLYVLPFYDLAFISWTVAWRSSFMTRPEQIEGWPIKYLDRERYRILSRRQADTENKNATTDAVRDKKEEKMNSCGQKNNEINW